MASDTDLAIGEGIAEGLEKATHNIFNIGMAKQKMTQERELFQIQKKKGELELKEMEAMGEDPEVLKAKKAIFTLGAKKAEIDFKTNELVLSEAEKKAKREMEDRQKEMELAQKFETNQLPAGMQYERKIGDTTISNKKTGGLESLFGPDGAPPVTTPEEREQFLSKLPAETQAVVKGLTNYELDLSKISSYRGDQRLQLAQAAKLYDPTFDMTQFPTRQKFRAEFSSGKMGANIRSFNTALTHLEELGDAIDKVPDSNVKAFTAAKRGFASQFNAKGDTAQAMAKENAALTAVAGEMATIFKNTGGTDQEIEKWHSSYNPNGSSEEKKQFIKTGVELMLGRLDAIDQDYERVMGKPNDKPLISERAEKAVNNIMKKLGGTDIVAKGFVRMTSPEGDTFDIPEANVAAAEKKGFKKNEA